MNNLYNRESKSTQNLQVNTDKRISSKYNIIHHLSDCEIVKFLSYRKCMTNVLRYNIIFILCAIFVLK